MAFYDWNKDGKKDFVDDYLEYNIYKESTNNSNDYSRDTSVYGIWGVVAVIVMLLSFLSKCGG